jgi:hypothetical protein
MNDTTDTKPDLISAELERALFKKFWAWLAIVGSIVIAAVTAVSVLVSQYLLLTAKSSSEQAAQRELEQLSNKIAVIDISSVEAAKKSAINQATSEASALAAATQAKQAQDLVTKITNLLETNKAVLSGVQQVQAIADLVASKPEFAQTVIAATRADLLSKIPTASDFFEVPIPSTRQYAQAMCPSGSIRISATCTNDNGAQAAVGPKFRSDGYVSCERYSTATNAEGTILCMKLRN